MNILQINTTDTKGGAALVAWNLKKTLEAGGHSMPMVVGYKRSQERDVREIFDTPLNFLLSKLAGRNVRARLHHHIAQWLKNDISLLPGKNVLNWPEFKQADIIHAHNLHSLCFNLNVLPALSQRKPFIWTLHDMWALTGGAAHSFDCPHWPTSGCDCTLPNTVPPQLGNNRKLWELKKKIYKNTSVHLVAPSQWMANQIKKSMLAEKPRTVIYNGVDTDIFKPTENKISLRQKLGLPTDKKLILFASKGGSRNPWKGWGYAEKIIANTTDSSIVFICLGGYDRPDMPKNVLTVPYVTDQNKLADYYAASDILLYPSIADNCPLTVLEAMACGLPVLTFATGGIPELVEHKKNGYVARYRDSDDLATGFNFLINLSKQDEDMFAEASHNRVKEQFSLTRMVDAYEVLYKKLITAS